MRRLGRDAVHDQRPIALVPPALSPRLRPRGVCRSNPALVCRSSLTAVHLRQADRFTVSLTGAASRPNTSTCYGSASSPAGGSRDSMSPMACRWPSSIARWRAGTGSTTIRRAIASWWAPQPARSTGTFTGASSESWTTSATMRAIMIRSQPSTFHWRK
jgi:hypothetical protein